MAYRPEGQQRQFKVWGQAAPSNNPYPQPQQGQWTQPQVSHPIPPQQSQWIPPQQTQWIPPQQTQWIPPNEPWRTLAPTPERTFVSSQMHYEGHEVPKSTNVLLILCKLLVVVVGMAAAIFGILALADVPFYRGHYYTSPGYSYYHSSYSEWPTLWFANLVCLSSLVIADILLGAVLFILSFAKPEFKLGTVANILLVLFNVIIGCVGIWLLVALLVKDGEGNWNICPERIYNGYYGYYGYYGRCTRVKMMICSTAFTLLLPILFIPTYLRCCCSVNIMIKK